VVLAVALPTGCWFCLDLVLVVLRLVGGRCFGGGVGCSAVSGFWTDLLFVGGGVFGFGSHVIGADWGWR
jgi:hypothetical protein